MSRTVIISVLAGVLVQSQLSMASDDEPWRATVTSERARAIAGKLFPEKCGPVGEACGITFDDRRGCPFEFVVLFPVEKRADGEPPAAVVKLDKNGGVIEVTSKKKRGCHAIDG